MPRGDNIAKVLVNTVFAALGVYTLASEDDPGNINQYIHQYRTKKLRADIVEIMEDEAHDDGSFGPIFLRLGWHASGTYDKKAKNGGCKGTMRFAPECDHGANAGLNIARNKLSGIQAKYTWATYADVWTLASVVAVEEMGGPKVDWQMGRMDAEAKECPPDGRLPDAAQGADHVRATFNRMGFDDREMVALIGAHAVGRCHTKNSGFEGPWTFSPTTFSNQFFVQLKDQKWTVKEWDGPKQYEDEGKGLMMLPTDIALLQDKEFKKYVDLYAKDEEVFFKDFAAAYGKLITLGTVMPRTSVYETLMAKSP